MSTPLLRSDLIEDTSLRGRAFAEAWTGRVESWLTHLFVGAVEAQGTVRDLSGIDVHGVAFALEPQLKEGRGGLRDVHALAWALAAGARVDRHLRVDLGANHDALFDIRVELHRQSGRPGDILTLDDQDAVAVTLGEPNADALMARVAQAGWRIARTSDEAWYDIVQRHGSTSHVTQGVRRPVDRCPDGSYMNNACIRGGRVTLVDELRPPTDAFAMLEVATIAAHERKRISYTTLNVFVGAPSPPEVWPQEAREAFVELLSCGHAAVEVIEVLELRGLWNRLIPQWRPCVCRPQRNAFHRFTVDRHLLETAGGAAELTHQVEHPEVLMTAALLHDIGKGYPELGDHCECGASIAADVAQRMGFAPQEVATIEVLVRHHLLLADTAMRRDLDDPATVRFVAGRLASGGPDSDRSTADNESIDGPTLIQRLALLRALTIADALATGPAAASRWRLKLIDRLARQTAVSIDRRSSSETMASSGTGDVLDWPGPVNVDPGKLSDHRSFPDVVQDELLAGVGVLCDAGGDRLSVAHDDLNGSLCRLAGVLALHGLEVRSANVSSGRGRVVEEFTVRVGLTGAVAWERVCDDVTKALDGRLAVRSRPDQHVGNRCRRQLLRDAARWPEAGVDRSAGGTVAGIARGTGPDPGPLSSPGSCLRAVTRVAVGAGTLHWPRRKSSTSTTRLPVDPRTISSARS